MDNRPTSVTPWAKAVSVICMNLLFEVGRQPYHRTKRCTLKLYVQS